ncbi:cytochrome c biogenesis protein CcsA [Catenovulum sp. SM1970]|uniref:cytochrome C assembly family protein n=1 Tax=Marinifaba aquimaris TaxID=2741323 RepID=UPI0015717B54|nr:cytochrome c biogenesis protein CcsA [Marinifaba aquimaris]NTS76049.1 cytochrome c biogenesis protein CcsA [Marinifaba aquimaris]
MQALAIAGIVAYFASAVALLLIFFKNKKIALPQAFLPGLVALLAHLNFIAFNFNIEDANGYNLLLVVNLICVVITSIAIAFAKQYHNYFVLPVCFVVSALVLSLDLFVPADLATTTNWTADTMLHISLALIAYALLIISTLLSIQYSFISHKLKQHDLSVLSLPIPALNLIEAQIFRILAIGTLLLTVSIVIGYAFLDNFWGSGQAHKTILASLAWLCFTSLLFGHYKLGWRGNRVLLLTAIGSTLLTIGYFGSRFIREIVLN